MVVIDDPRWVWEGAWLCIRTRDWRVLAELGQSTEKSMPKDDDDDQWGLQMFASGRIWLESIIERHQEEQAAPATQNRDLRAKS